SSLSKRPPRGAPSIHRPVYIIPNARNILLFLCVLIAESGQQIMFRFASSQQLCPLQQAGQRPCCSFVERDDSATGIRLGGHPPNGDATLNQINVGKPQPSHLATTCCGVCCNECSAICDLPAGFASSNFE